METVFTPWASLGGGVLIGLAATALMLTLGRVFGATGVLAGLLRTQFDADFAWRAVLLAGMVSGPLALYGLTGQMPAVEVPGTLGMLILGGFLVGIGVSYGGGCTSGHGVCGMARLSVRSIVATMTFMIATFITVYVLRHVLGV